MGWLGRLFATQLTARPRDPADDFWYRDVPIAGMAAGEIVTPKRAQQIPAVVDALDAVTDPLAHLPLKVYRRTGPGDEDKEPAPDHPAARLLARPSAEGLSRYLFRAQLQWELALHANAYAEWIFGPGGAEGWRLHDPELVRVERQAGQAVYWIHDKQLSRVRRLPPDLVWHLRTVPLDRERLCGISPVALNSETLSRALAVQAYGARFFANDGQAGGIIEHPSHFKTKEDRDRFTAAWRKARTGRHARRDAVLEYGMKYNREQLDNEKSQFIETEKMMAIQVARIWHVPPHKIRSLDGAIKSNIEQQSLEFVTELLGWIALNEASLKQDVIDPLTEGANLTDDFFAEYNVAGLMRGDLLSRYRAFAMGRQWGWLSVNEIRRMESMPPIGDDGDVYLEPMNMQSAGDAADEDTPGGPSADPSGSQSE